MTTNKVHMIEKVGKSKVGYQKLQKVKVIIVMDKHSLVMKVANARLRHYSWMVGLHAVSIFLVMKILVIKEQNIAFAIK